VSGMGRVLPISILAAGLALLYPMQRSIDKASPEPQIEKESLYLSSGKTIKTMSLGLEALTADIYWIRTVQYFGRKVVDSDKPSLTATRARMDLLAPLLNIVVTLDPQHIPAYRFGAIFLPDRDLVAAIALVDKGIRENPNDWRLYADLAYIYWQAGNKTTGAEQTDNYAKASEWYEKGSTVMDAPWWLRDLAGLMKIRGGSREAARAVYSSYLTSDDENIRGQAIFRLKQLRSLDELDAINVLLARYKEQTGACPTNLKALAPIFHSLKLTLNEDLVPVDPDGFAYAYDVATCKASLAPETTVPL
jgi:tetratricopeptide (TPR) repeat protein